MSINSRRCVSWKQPLVSALMVTKNRHAMARENIKSLLGQTWKWKEIIVVDDSDRREILSDDPRVKHVYLNSNFPMWEKHDLAMAHAQGEIMVYWDDDDWFASHKIESQIQPIIDDKADMVGIKRRFIYRLTDHTWWEFTKQVPKDRSWLGNGLGAPGFQFHDGTCMFTRKACEGLEHGRRHVSQKLMMIYSMVKRGERLTVLDRWDLFVYVRHGTNTWQYREDLRMVSVEAPTLVPEDRMEFWRSGAWNYAA